LKGGKGKLESERGRTLRESANDGGSPSGVILEDLFDGAGSWSHFAWEEGAIEIWGEGSRRRSVGAGARPWEEIVGIAGACDGVRDWEKEGGIWKGK